VVLEIKGQLIEYEKLQIEVREVKIGNRSTCKTGFAMREPFLRSETLIELMSLIIIFARELVLL